MSAHSAIASNGNNEHSIAEAANQLKPIPLNIAAHKPEHTKLIHWIRHGQATSNAAAGGVKNHPCYMSWDFHDARLSPEGQKQVVSLREKTTRLRPQVVLVSPLSRALYTALGGFEHLIDQVPFLVHEELRERMGQHPCDSRRAKSLLVKEFAKVNFDGVHTEEDVMWDAVNRETNDQLSKRIAIAMNIIKQRPEKEIAVVGHSSFLEHLFNVSLQVADKDLTKWFDNCELRSVVITFLPSSA